MIKAAFQLTVLIAWLAQSAPTPLRTGDVAREFRDQDVAALVADLPTGSTPWLINAESGGFRNPAIEAYLAPTVTSPALRRGTSIAVMWRRTPRKEWTLERRELSYAQVAIPGRSFDDIQGDQDMNRPFHVIGRFDDDELVRIVQLVRSDPPLGGGVHIQPWPIVSIERKADDSVDVLLRRDSMGGQALKMRKVGQDWLIGTGTWDI
jgi:hypothetical protein